jgi:hypothetical protein
MKIKGRKRQAMVETDQRGLGLLVPWFLRVAWRGRSGKNVQPEPLHAQHDGHRRSSTNAPDTTGLSRSNGLGCIEAPGDDATRHFEKSATSPDRHAHRN